MFSLWCSWEVSRSEPGSVLPSVPLLWTLSPFIKMTSQWLLDASLAMDDSRGLGATWPALMPVPEASAPVASVLACSGPSLGSASGLAPPSFVLPSRFSLLLERRRRLPSWGRRRRACLRPPPPPPLLGLLAGLLFRLSGGADFLPEAGEAAEINHKSRETLLKKGTMSQTHFLLKLGHVECCVYNC